MQWQMAFTRGLGQENYKETYYVEVLLLLHCIGSHNRKLLHNTKLSL